MSARKKDFLRGVLVASIAAMGLSACSTSSPSLMANSGSTNFHPIQIAESVERMELYARPDGMSLSLRDKMAVSQFLDTFAANGDGPLYINVPRHMAGSPGVQQTRALIDGAIMDNGLLGAPVQEGQYQGYPGRPAPVIISYRQQKTITPDCRVRGNMVKASSGSPYPEFGCAASANLAAMISDPGQFIAPYAMTPPNSKRRMVIYDKYIAGESTAGEKSEGQGISTGSNN